MEAQLITAKNYPDHSKEINRINRIVGQLEGVKRMVVERRYCPDIMNQTRAISSALKALESSILEKHLKCCVRDAFNSSDENFADAKIEELINLFQKK